MNYATEDISTRETLGGERNHAAWAAAIARLPDNQRGVTGIEAAIVLIAFVIVASVFAFSVLSVGLLSAEEVKQMVTGSMEDTSATLFLRGGVVAEANSSRTAVESIKLNLSRATQSKESMDLSAAGTVVTYLDEHTAINCTGSGSPGCSWSANWLIGSGDLVDPGEQVEITVSLINLTPVLDNGKEFTIQVKPSKGAVVIVTRRLPAELKGITNLQ